MNCYTMVMIAFVDINSSSLYYIEIIGVYSKIVSSEQVIGYGFSEYRWVILYSTERYNSIS
jgi:hypothetical protein